MDAKDDLQNISETRNHGKKCSFAKGDMEHALKLVKSGKSIREAARISSVPYATTRRYWIKQMSEEISNENLASTEPYTSPLPTSKSVFKGILKNSVSESDKVKSMEGECKKTFSDEQEMELASLFNGKNGTESRKIVYEMAVKWNVGLHKNWSKDGMADVDWIINFRKRLPDLLERRYKNNQKGLKNENLSTYCNNNSLPKSTDVVNSNHLPNSISPVAGQSDSSEFGSFGNESSSSNNDLNIVKMEPNEYLLKRKRRNTISWKKRKHSNLFSGNRRRKINLDFFNRNNTEDIKLFSTERSQSFSAENPNFSLSEILNEKDESESRQQQFFVPSQFNNNAHSNVKQTSRPDEHFEESVSVCNTNHHLNNDRATDSDDSVTSKREKMDDVQILKNSTKTLNNVRTVSKQNLDADELFLLSLLPALKKIPEKDKIKVRIKLLEVMDQF